MRLFTLLIILVSTVMGINAQRLVPIIEEGAEILLPVHGPDGRVQDMIEYDGKLLFAGAFDSCNEVVTNRMATWDGQQFESFPAPDIASNEHVQVLLNCPLGLFAAGTMASQQHIVKFNGLGWEVVAGGVDQRIHDMLFFDGKVIVAGRFSNAGGSPASYIAAYDGSTWSSMGDGFNDRVHDLFIHNDELFVCGKFTQSGSESALRIAKWNGSGFEQIGAGLNDEAVGMGEFNGDLIIGGFFDQDGTETQTLNGLATLQGEDIVPFSPDAPGQPFGKFMTQGDQLYMTNVTIPGATGIGDTYVWDNGEIREFGGMAQWKKLIDFQGEKYLVNGLSPSLEAFIAERDFYQTCAIMKVLDDDGLLADLENEYLKARILPSAPMFTDPFTWRPGLFTAPFEELRSTIYSASPWLTGLDETNEVVAAVQTFHLTNDLSYGYNCGPISSSYDQDYLNRYMRVWKVSREEILNHQNAFADPGYQAPEAILNWPANGRSGMGEATHMAPFMDLNENGWYEPMQGEYPVIRGDQAVFYILNDHRRLLNQNSLGINLYVMVYSHDSGSEDLQQTVFVNYVIDKVSESILSDLRFGMWADLDIGTAVDDYIGCEPELSMFYGYNGDALDEPSSSSIGYGEDIPAEGVVFLNTEIKSFMYYNNSSGTNGEPQLPLDYDQYLNSTWRNGQHLVWGGDGLNPNTGADLTMPVDFMFPDCPTTPFGDDVWNEIAAGNVPADRRGVGASEMPDLQQGDRICLDIAFITAFSNDPEVEFGEVLALKERTENIRTYFESWAPECSPATFPLSIGSIARSSQEFTLYPNPGNGVFRIIGGEQGLTRVECYDAHGKLMKVVVLNGMNEINLSDLPNGVYILRLQQRNGEVFNTRAVILH